MVVAIRNEEVFERDSDEDLRPKPAVLCFSSVQKTMKLSNTAPASKDFELVQGPSQNFEEVFKYNPNLKEGKNQEKAP